MSGTDSLSGRLARYGGWRDSARSAIAEQLARLAPEILDGALGRLAARRPGRRPSHGRACARAAARARRRRRLPTTSAAAGRTQLRGIAHGRELPRLELLGGDLGDARERALQPLERGRAGGSTGASASRRSPSKSAALTSAARPPRSPTISSSCLMARWMSTLVAPSERPSARAISRLSMPSAKRMISASRRSSGSGCTPSSTRLSSSRPSTSCSVVCGAASGRRVVDRRDRLARAVAVQVGGEVVGDADQPRAQRPAVGLALRALEVAVGLQERLLGQVLRVVVIADAVVRVAVHVAQVRPVEI